MSAHLGWRRLATLDARAPVLACRTIDGHAWGHALDAAAIGSGPVRGQLNVHVADGSWHVEGLLQVHEPLAWLAPLTVHARGAGGWLLLPGADAPMDLADARAVSSSHPIGRGRPGALAWRSQQGWIVRDRGGSRLFDAVHAERLDERAWRVGLAWQGLSPGQDFAVAVRQQRVLFLSEWRLDKAMGRLDGMDGSDRSYGTHKPHSTHPHTGIGRIEIPVAGQALTVRVREQPTGPATRTTARELRLTHREEDGVHRVAVRIARGDTPWRPLRIEAEWETPVGNPTWDGPATVVIPGNFARTNYHPDCLHGGGPKYGPDPIPRARAAHRQRRRARASARLDIPRVAPAAGVDFRRRCGEAPRGVDGNKPAVPARRDLRGVCVSPGRDDAPAPRHADDLRAVGAAGILAHATRSTTRLCPARCTCR